MTPKDEASAYLYYRWYWPVDMPQSIEDMMDRGHTHSNHFPRPFTLENLTPFTWLSAEGMKELVNALKNAYPDYYIVDKIPVWWAGLEVEPDDWLHLPHWR